MKTLRIVLVGLVALAVVLVGGALTGSDEAALGIANPAAVYCQELGYEYRIVDTDEGQYGICGFPDGSECDAWRFLECNCGGSYSYCAINGYDWITKTDGQNPYSPDYCVCVHDGEEIGAVTELMDLDEKLSGGCSPPPPLGGSCPPPPDTDGDGFDDSVEAYVGTDSTDACPDDPGDDAWPPDINADTVVDVSDGLTFLAALPSVQGSPNYTQRLDFSPEGPIIDIFDALTFLAHFPSACPGP